MAVTDPPLFKIGMAKDPQRRLANIQTSCPFDLVIFFKRRCAKRESAANEERSLHARFRDKHRRGEWFQLEQSDLQQVMRSPEEQYEQARKAIEAVSSRQARSQKVSRGRYIDRALGRDVASFNDADLRNIGGTKSDVRTGAITER